MPHLILVLALILFAGLVEGAARLYLRDRDRSDKIFNPFRRDF